MRTSNWRLAPHECGDRGHSAIAVDWVTRGLDPQFRPWVADPAVTYNARAQPLETTAMTNVPNWVTLTEGEEVIWQGRPTLYSYTGRLLLPAVVIAIGLLLWGIESRTFAAGTPIAESLPVGLIGGILVLLGLAGVARVLLDWWTVRYLLTTDEVYRKEGLVSRQVRNLRLDQIQNTSFQQTVLGRLLSYGDVSIETAGSHTTEITFAHVPQPEAVVGHITEALDRHAR